MAISKRKQKELTEKWRQHNKDLKRQHRHNEMMSFEEFLDWTYGRKRARSKQTTNKRPNLRPPAGRDGYKTIPSHGPMQGDLTRKESKVYNGKRELKGIAVMHKSNLIPVFSQEEAEDISKMSQ